MLSRFFLILAGLLAGMALRDGSTAPFSPGLPALALLSLLIAVAATPPSIAGGAQAQLEEVFREWLDIWHRLRTTPERDRPAAEEALASAAHAIVLTANDRVVKSLQAAREQDLSVSAVARLVLDMRRNLRRAGLTVRPADLEAYLAPRQQGTSTRAAAPETANPASFLS